MKTDLVEKHIGSKNTAKEMRELNAIAKQCEVLKSDGYGLYAINTTYKSRSGLNHRPDIVCRYFNSLYFHELLPKKLFQDKRWIYKIKENQPYVYCFLEPHNEVGDELLRHPSGLTEWVRPIRLHHHAMVAVRPEHVEAMEMLVGEDTLVPMHESIKTSVIKHADFQWLGYAGKNLVDFREDLLIYTPPKASVPIRMRKKDSF